MALTQVPNEAEGVNSHRFSRVNFISDPIWGQIEITKTGPWGPGEETILDNPWLQRMRRIRQLQSTWWVFPTAEHSRFTHLLGTMHLAGRFAHQLYESLKRGIPDTPSLPVVEETLRLAGLLHDVGHGPFGHFFDNKYLIPRFGIDHEVIGRRLITQELAPAISALRMSPSGFFEAGEAVDPLWVAWLMDPREMGDYLPPAWVRACKPVLCGPATVDNMDYVPRDAYMCGVSVTAVDVNRLMQYSFVQDGTVVLHGNARGTLQMFLTARLYLYMNIYFHRTARRVDLAMEEIFGETVEHLLAGNPLDHLDEYLELTDWALLDAVRRWRKEPEGTDKRRLGDAWQRLMERHLHWQVAYEVPVREVPGREELTAAIRAELPAAVRDRRFVVDIASATLAPHNPMADDGFVVIYDPLRGELERNTSAQMVARLPQYHQMVRVFCDDERMSEQLRVAAEKVLSGMSC